MEKWYSTELVHKASGMSNDKWKERKTPGNAVEGRPDSEDNGFAVRKDRYK
jgi:hypothetical protein